MKAGLKVSLALCILSTLVAGCGTRVPASKYKEGTYTGEAQGQNGPVKVSVEIKSDRISAVKVVEHKETPGISDAAIERVPRAIVEKQSTEVDAVSGATVTSKAIMQATKKAIQQAQK
ncbi:MAG TPA: FMN-binding protein [Firmicutes bacterium]|nr:FMN-binding protein [Bacillota bacterium]